MPFIKDENDAGILIDEQGNKIAIDPTIIVSDIPMLNTEKGKYVAEKIKDFGSWKVVETHFFDTELEAQTKINELKLQ